MIRESEQLQILRTSIFRENEVRTNRLIGFVFVALFVIDFLYAILSVLNLFGNAEPGDTALYLSFCGILCVGYALAQIASRKNKKIVKIFLLTFLIASNTVTECSCYVYGHVIFTMPIFLSACYYRRSVTAITSLAVWAGLIISTFYARDNFLYGHSLSEILELSIIPQSTLVFLFAVIGIFIAESGKRQVYKQAEKSLELSAVESEIELSAKIQGSVLPPQDFTSPNKAVNLHAAIFPAREVAGDFYDYFMIDESNLIFLVADVSDKGFAAAMFMMQARDAIRNFLQSTKSLKMAATHANAYLAQNNKGGMFVTLWVGCINTNTGIGKYVNAGHTQPLLKHQDGTVEVLENTPDLFMGAFDNAEYTSHVFQLKKGETLILYTDGVTDAQNDKGEDFGLENLKKTIDDSENTSSGVYNNVSHSVMEFSKNNQFDDITILSLHSNAEYRPITLDLEVEAKEENISKVINSVNELLGKTNCPEHPRKSIDIIIDEICENIANYAYDNDSGTMAIKCFATDNFLEMSFEDSGKAFNPLDVPPPEEGDILNIGGFGIHFVKNLADEVFYKRVGEKNRLTVKVVWVA